MEIFVLSLILLALLYIGDKLSSLVKTLNAIGTTLDMKGVQANNNINLNTSDITEQLKRIVTLMDGDEKLEAMKQKHRKELRERLIKAIMYAEKKNEKDAKVRVDELWNEAEFEEKQDNYPMKFKEYENWVVSQEKEQRNFERYGSLLPKIRKYLKRKEIIEKYDSNIEKELETDHSGREWIIEKMLQEGRLKKIMEHEEGDSYSGYVGRDVLKHYEIVEPKN